MKSSKMGITAGIVAGMMLGTAAGFAAKSMMTPKSATKKTISNALNTVGEMFTNLSKFTG